MTGTTESRQAPGSMRGFTLVELMITVAIVAILAAVAYPAYTDQVVKSRRSDGQAFLMQVMNKQEQHYTNHNEFTSDLTNLGYGSADDVQSPEGWYQVGAAACGGGLSDCVKLTAEALGAQASQDTECQNLTLDSLGQKGISGGTGTASDCW